MNQLSRWTCYTDMDKEISKEMGNIATGFVYLGYLFKEARDTELFREAGYHSLYDYVQNKYSITRTQALRFMQINDIYSIDGNSVEIDPKYIGYGSSKLTEMLGIPEEIRDEIPPEITRKELREIKADLAIGNEPEKSCAHGAQTQVNTSTPEEFDPIETVVKSYFEISREEYKKYFEIAQYDQQLMNCLTKDKLFNVLAPSKFKMIRLEKGNLMINESGLKLMCWTGEKYQISHEEFRTMFLQVFTSTMTDSYQEIYGKPLEEPKLESKPEPKPEIKPVQKPVPEEPKKEIPVEQITEEEEEPEEAITETPTEPEPQAEPEKVQEEPAEEILAIEKPVDLEPEEESPAAGHMNPPEETIPEEDKEERPIQTIYSFLLTSSIEEQAEYFKQTFECPPKLEECLDIEMGESCVICWKNWLNKKKEN